MVEDLIITPFMKIGPAWARNRRKANVKTGKNPQLRFLLIIPVNSHTVLMINYDIFKKSVI